MLFQTALFFLVLFFALQSWDAERQTAKKVGRFFFCSHPAQDGWLWVFGCGGGWFLLLCCFAPLFCFLFLLSLDGKLGESQVLVLLEAMEEIFFSSFLLVLSTLN